ncbi:hypothetical protein OG417_44975 [Actinoallomurus sp. NBC_01490]|uniref:hypothetical protein n=1 Tax=Actinoallomurus sp. NBC_01490 TaxID=2903557 RepID=UPI002E3162C1|nr:hypothetical protein [Actinoallomurus sp. NBC_01490]
MEFVTSMMTGPSQIQALLERRGLLFAPGPRLGWLFRDRWLSYTPFREPEPARPPMRADLEQRVSAAEAEAARHLNRTLPASAIAAGILGLFSACSATDYVLGRTPLPLGSFVLALIVAGLGGTPAAIATAERRRAREAWHQHRIDADRAYQTALRDWRARKNRHEAHERAAANTRPEWGSVPRPPGRRLEVFGGTLWGWEALLSIYGTSALTAGPLLVLDLSRERVCAELAILAREAGICVDVQALPAQLATSSLLTGLDQRELVDAVVESMYGGSPEDTRAERSMDDLILTKIVDALGANVSLARIVAAVGLLMGEPRTAPVLDPTERRRIAHELFSVEYRRHAHASLARIESYLTPLRHLGTDHDTDRPTSQLTCITLDSQARNARSELLTDLIVQWLIHRITASNEDRPSVVVAGADELARRHLERLSDACERRGVPVTLLYRRLRETGQEMIGGGAVAFMRLGNHQDATRAADFIGRDHKFVLSQITKNLGGSESHTDTDTQGIADTDTTNWSTSIGTSTNHGTTRSSGATRSGGGPLGLFGDRSTNTGTARSRGGGTSRTDTHAEGRSLSRNWSSAYAYVLTTNWSDADTTQRVYEYAVEPVTLQHLPDHALLLIETRPEGGRNITPIECDPAIVTLDRVATTPHPPLPPHAQGWSQRPEGGPLSVPPPPRWARPTGAEPPRPPLPYAPGPPPGYRTGPAPVPEPARDGQPVPRHE